MTTGRTVAGVAGANVVAIEGTNAAAPVVPFLDVPLWAMTVNGVATNMTPQSLIVVTTGILSALALIVSIVRRK